MDKGYEIKVNKKKYNWCYTVQRYSISHKQIYNLKVQEISFMYILTQKKSLRESIFYPSEWQNSESLLSFCVGGEYKEIEYGKNTNW